MTEHSLGTGVRGDTIPSMSVIAETSASKRSKRVATVLLVAVFMAGVGTLTWAALFTNLGVFLVGHDYWLWRARTSTDDAECEGHLRRVIGATQYGSDQVETYVLELDSPADRVRLWQRAIESANNDVRRERFAFRLERELGASGQSHGAPRLE